MYPIEKDALEAKPGIIAQKKRNIEAHTARPESFAEGNRRLPRTRVWRTGVARRHVDLAPNRRRVTLDHGPDNLASYGWVCG